MDALAVVSAVRATQAALAALATLQLTAYLFPPQSKVTEENPIPSYEYIVVGAGSAGCVVARRLAEAHAHVLLIEAGGDPPIESVLPGLYHYIPQTHSDWNYTTTSDGNGAQFHNNKRIELTQGHMLGGGSSANVQAYVRGAPEDYQTWARAAGDRSWEWEHLLPYFIKSEHMIDKAILHSPTGRFHGTHGYLGITRQLRDNIPRYLKAFEEVGKKTLLDNNAGATLGYLQPQFNIADGIRQSTAYGYLSHGNPDNLDLLKRTLVTRILFDKCKNAIGVEVLTEDSKTITLKATEEVIVTAGGLNSPKLLLLSGLGPAEHLRSLGVPVVADIPAIGSNLQDHHSTLLFTKLQPSSEPEPPLNPTGIPPSLFFGFGTTNPHQSYPDYESGNLVLTPNSTKVLYTCALTNTLNYEFCQSLYEAALGHETLLTFMNIMHPKSRGRVLLKSSDPRDKPLIDMNYYGDETDLDSMVDYIEDFLKVLNSSMFRDAGARVVLPKVSGCDAAAGSREYWRCYASRVTGTQYHYVGACAMGSVVDARLRVRGVGRLRVADSCAIPTLTSGNINAPVIALAEKAADMIKEDHYLLC